LMQVTLKKLLNPGSSADVMCTRYAQIVIRKEI
jgi:hypothetical protein